MRIAVISDVHGNLPALERVLDAVESARVDEVWCLGDLVGYGPFPNECCAAAQAAVAVCLAGNHDLLALGRANVPAADFNPDAAASGAWTAERLNAASRTFLEELAPEAHPDGADLYHGSARDPVWEYVLGVEAVEATLARARAPLVLVGHSHVALAVDLEGGVVAGGKAPAGTEIALGPAGARVRRLLNPGSVGQPRDGDRRAAWLLIDFDRRVASFRREEYDIESVQRAILDAGLPAGLAERLAHGV